MRLRLWHARNRRTCGRGSGAFDSAIPTTVVVGAVAIVFEVRLAMFLVVAHEIGEPKAVVTGNEIDAGVWTASAALVKITRTRQPAGKLAGQSDPRLGHARPTVAP